MLPPSTRRTTLAVASLAFLAAAAIAVAGTWQAPAVDISTPGDDVNSAALAVDPSGTATAVWTRGVFPNFVVQAARRVNGIWTAPVDVSGSDATITAPAVAVDASGVVTAVWQYDDGSNYVVQAARFANGSWSRPVVLTTPGDTTFKEPAVAVDAAGVVTAVWVMGPLGSRVVQAARFSGGAWGAPVTLSSPADPETPQVAAGPAGSAVALWVRSDGANYRVQGARYANGAWSGATNVSVAGDDGTSPDVTMDSDGTATAVWKEGPVFGRTPYAARSSAGGGWTAPFALAGPDTGEPDPQVTSGPPGTATAAWTQIDSGVARVHVRSFSSGSMGPASTISSAEENAFLPTITTGPDGVVTAAWVAVDAGGARNAEAARLSGGAWGAPQALGGTSPAAGPVQLGVDAAGAVTAEWLGESGANDVARTTQYVTAPSAPRTPAATAGDASAQVSWTAPIANGGAAITSYTATASPGGRQCTATAPTATCTVTGLANGTAYTFTVTGSNAQGTGPASVATAAVTPRPTTITDSLLPSRKRLKSGQTMTVGIRVKNTGALAAAGVNACVRLPSALTVTRAKGARRSGRTACFAIGNIQAGAQATRTMTVRAVARRRVTARITGNARATGIARVAASPRAVTVTPGRARARVTG